MLSFEHELRTHGVPPRRDAPFSLHPELRIAAWAGAMLLATAAGIFLKNNLHRLGPITLATLIALAALACYAAAAKLRNRAPAQPYVLLLAALLVSADVAFLEQQYHLLDRGSFLLVAVLHAAAAYAYRSRIVLSLSLAALAAWIGAEDWRPFFAAALVILWREIHLQLDGDRTFLRVFEHFAANLALWGGLLLLGQQALYDLGCVITLVLATLVIAWGRAQRSEPFVLYGFLYAVIAADALILRRLQNNTAVAFTIFVSMIVAVAVLVKIHHEHRR